MAEAENRGGRSAGLTSPVVVRSRLGEGSWWPETVTVCGGAEKEEDVVAGSPVMPGPFGWSGMTRQTTVVLPGTTIGHGAAGGRRGAATRRRRRSGERGSKEWEDRGERRSGCRVSRSKNHGVITYQLRDSLSSHFPCLIGEFPIKYLGLPLSIRKITASSLQPFVEKLEKKLSSWWASMLSRNEHLALVRHVFYVMPTHILIVMSLHTSILQQDVHGHLDPAALVQYVHLRARLQQITLSGAPNTLTWRWTSNDVYSAKSCYKALFAGETRIAMGSNEGGGCDGKPVVVVPEIKYTKLFINGEFVDAASGKTFETRDPRTGDVLAHIAEADKADVDLAVEAAREAFEHGMWPRMSGYERSRAMNKLADLMEQHIEELAALDGADAGKLLLLGKIIDIPSAVQMLRYYAGAADKIHGESLRVSGKYQGYTLKEPIGVVGIIIPWNFPSLMFFLKISPALAAGCTVVVKPAEQTPLSALYYAHLAKLVAFTGSGEVGRLIMEASARSNLKTVSLELGGKSPLIIFDDADVDMAVELSRLAIFFNKEGIYDEFVKRAVVAAQNWKVGDPFDVATNMGPQVDKEQFERVLRYIEHGKSEGATLLTGGKPASDKGYYIEPTIFADVKEDMKIAQDEIFGPVMSLMKFKTVDEAIEKANCTKYGLAAGIITKNLDIANRVSRSVRAGTVWVNCYFAFDPEAPFGGYKMSGFGRDQGMMAIDKYMQVKSVITAVPDSPWY
ncbi:Aldehyde dehydrogenase family 2 member C4 [Triticum urartu]|uniref:Aldehyde dehydrogenase family 2 member C4 n=1 Tax=Triticum urartu TaxID=4572 RepID=M7ZLU9_TRIUA|nr:Aldehyde dehydrogenase family 2 member C4 [Triticum urartu]